LACGHGESTCRPASRTSPAARTPARFETSFATQKRPRLFATAATRTSVRSTGKRTSTDMSAPVMGEPSPEGRFGRFGGRFIPETLVPACADLERAFRAAWGDAGYRAELDALLRDYAGRPSPLTECHRLSTHLGVRLLLKREDLNHTGSHKINNVLGQALLAKRMGKTRLVAETGAGQHGVATATA